MDWEGLNADVEMIMDRHYTPGRTASIRGTVLHHNGGNLTVEDCHRAWQTREASAHYQVEQGGRIGQLVNDWDTAWHAGDANPWTIGIEHANDGFGPWTISDETLEAGAHLVAAVHRKYGLGRPEWGVNVFGHSDFMATDCPGEIAGSQNAAYMRRAQEWYDAMAAGAEAPEPTPAPAPAPAPAIPDVRYCTSSDPDGVVWNPEMVNRTCTGGSGDTYAGDGNPIRWLAMDFPGWYQVCTQKSGWLPQVRKYDIDDLENGCAGDGSPILYARCYYETQNPDATGWLRVRYAVANVGEGFLPEMEDTTCTAGSGDDCAGNGGTVSAFYAYLVRA